MSNYNTKQQLNKITQSFSKTFNIKLSKVRNQVAKDEGYKCYDALADSLPDGLVESFDDKVIVYPEAIAAVQKRPAMYLGNLKHNIFFDQIFETFLGNFKSGKSSEINVSIEKNAEIKISDNSFGIEDFIFQEIIEKEIDNRTHFNYFMDVDDEEKLDHFKNAITVNNNSFRYLIMVNALSATFNISYKEDNKFFSYSFENGILLKRKIKSTDLTNGLHISFRINLKYFKQEDVTELNLDHDFYNDGRIRELLTSDIHKLLSRSSELNKGLHIKSNYYNRGENHKYNLFNDSNKEIFHRHFYTNKIKMRDCEPLNYMTLSKKDENSNFSVSSIFVNSNDGSDFECHIYINDEYIEINDYNRHLKEAFFKSKSNYENGLKGAIKHFPDKYVLPNDFKGVKAILLVNKNENFPRKTYSDIFVQRTEKEIFDLLTHN